MIALQNAKLYQDLKAEKQRLIQADEDARKELARDLHDGPTQSVAAIAMRVNFIRTLVNRDPHQALEELNKIERLARETSREIRGMLFTLRPLVLETEGLAAAIDTVIDRLEETHNLPVTFSGRDAAELLDENAQSIVFSIVEEALSNARKYAQASHVDVRFWKENNLFVAQVQSSTPTASVARRWRSWRRPGNSPALSTSRPTRPMIQWSGASTMAVPIV